MLPKEVRLEYHFDNNILLAPFLSPIFRRITYEKNARRVYFSRIWRKNTVSQSASILDDEYSGTYAY